MRHVLMIDGAEHGYVAAETTRSLVPGETSAAALVDPQTVAINSPIFVFDTTRAGQLLNQTRAAPTDVTTREGVTAAAAFDDFFARTIIAIAAVTAVVVPVTIGMTIVAIVSGILAATIREHTRAAFGYPDRSVIAVVSPILIDHTFGVGELLHQLRMAERRFALVVLVAAGSAFDAVVVMSRVRGHRHTQCGNHENCN
nr:hypothetical protein [Pseudolysobacter antarcticus]